MQGMIVRVLVDIIIFLSVYGLVAGIRNPWAYIRGEEKAQKLTKLDWTIVWVVRIIMILLVNVGFFLTYLDQYPQETLIFLAYQESDVVCVLWAFFSSIHHFHRYLTRHSR